MYQTIGVIELKSIAKGIEATDAALKSAGISLISAHPACPGKYEIILTGSISNVTAAVEHVKERYEERMVDYSILGRVEPQVIEAVLKAAPRRVVYVSCHVPTQARDVKLLCEGGYRFEKCQPVDMFCYAGGVENVLSLVLDE